MKYIKFVLLIFTLVFSVSLFGCGGEEKINKTVEELKTEVRTIFDAYSASDHGSFKMIAVNGDKTSTVDMIYNYDDDKSGILSLKTLLTSEQGTMSCYVIEEDAYINRYDQSKTTVKVTSKEGETIANDYSFDVFTKYINVMLGDSFFNSLEITSFKDNVLTANLSIGRYDISGEEESDVLTEVFEGIVCKTSVTLEVVYNETGVASVKVVLVGEETASIEVQFIEVSEENIDIEYPDFSDYK